MLRDGLSEQGTVFSGSFFFRFRAEKRKIKKKQRNEL